MKGEGDIQMEIDQQLSGQHEGIDNCCSWSVSKLIGFFHYLVLENLKFDSFGPHKFCRVENAWNSRLHFEKNWLYPHKGFTQVTARETNIKSLVTNHKKELKIVTLRTYQKIVKLKIQRKGNSEKIQVERRNLNRITATLYCSQQRRRLDLVR